VGVDVYLIVLTIGSWQQEKGSWVDSLGEETQLLQIGRLLHVVCSWCD
jgi:hypothetical protein